MPTVSAVPMVFVVSVCLCCPMVSMVSMVASGVMVPMVSVVVMLPIVPMVSMGSVVVYGVCGGLWCLWCPEHVSEVTFEDLRSNTTPPGDSDHIEDPCDTQVTIESHPEHQCDDNIVVLPAASTSDTQIFEQRLFTRHSEC